MFIILMVASEKDDDLVFVDKCLQGNTQAFNHIVLKYQGQVFNIAYRLLGHRDEAEEVAQDIFVSVYKNLKNFRRDSKFSTWIYRIALNHSKNRLKYLSARGYYKNRSMDNANSKYFQRNDNPREDCSKTPDKVYEKNELESLIQEAISGLEEKFSVIIVLRDIQGFDYSEISKILDIPIGTVKSRLHRGRTELKNKLSKIL